MHSFHRNILLAAVLAVVSFTASATDHLVRPPRWLSPGAGTGPVITPRDTGPGGPPTFPFHFPPTAGAIVSKSAPASLPAFVVRPSRDTGPGGPPSLAPLFNPNARDFGPGGAWWVIGGNIINVPAPHCSGGNPC